MLKVGKKILGLVCLAVLGSMAGGATNVAAATTPVTDWNGLKEAVEKGEDAALTQNLAASGGMIDITRGSMVIDLATFGITGTATDSHALFHVSGVGTTVTLKNGSLLNNTGYLGGAVSLERSSAASINDVTFKGNTATQRGGAAYNNGLMYLTGAVFENNIASLNDSETGNNNGGAIWNGSELYLMEGNSFLRNVSGRSGGAIANEWSDTENAVITAAGNLAFSGNAANTTNLNYGGGAVYNSGSIIFGTQSTAISATFTDNAATSANGGAIFNAAGGTIDINGTANFGAISDAGVYDNGNTALHYGGAIWNAGDITFKGEGAFYGNKTIDSANNTSGGAIYNRGKIRLEGTFDFGGNTVTKGFGGAISNGQQASNLELIGTFSFLGNAILASMSANPAEPKTGGGAIYNNGTALLRGNFDFKNNTVQNASGGAIFNDTGSVMTLAGTMNFNNNVTAGSKEQGVSGGAIANRGELTITGTRGGSGMATATLSAFEDAVSSIQFSNNTSAYDGGAIYTEGANKDNRAVSNIDGVDFSNNTAVQRAGAVRGGAYSTTNVNNSRFSGNESESGFGGAISSSDTETIVNIRNSYFSDNSTTKAGGAVTNGYKLTIINSSFIDNHVDSTGTGGGGVSFNGQVFKLIADEGDVVFSGNKKGDVSDGLYLYEGNKTALNLNAGNGGEIRFDDRVYGDSNQQIVQLNAKDVVYYSYDALLNNIAAEDMDAPHNGRIVFNNKVMNLDLVLNDGTLVIGDDTSIIGNNKYIENTSLTMNGGMLDLKNGVIENKNDNKIDFTSVTVNGAANLALDLNLSGDTVDYIGAAITGSGKLNISDLGLLGDFDSSYDLGKSKQFQFAESNSVETAMSAIQQVIVTNNAGYQFSIGTTGAGYGQNAIDVMKVIDRGGLAVALDSGTYFDASARFTSDREEITTWDVGYKVFLKNAEGTSGEIKDARGTNVQQGTDFKLDGNGKSIVSAATNGERLDGVVVGTMGDYNVKKTFSANDIESWEGFKTALTNYDGSTITLNNVTFQNNELDVYNTGTMFLSGNNSFAGGVGTAVDGETPYGVMNIVGGSTSSERDVAQQQLYVGNLATFTLSASNLKSTTKNDGVLNLNGGTLDKQFVNIKGGGTTNIAGELTSDTDVSQGTVNIADGATVTNNGTLQATNALLNKGTLKTEADKVDAKIDNHGTLELSGGTASTYVVQNNTITDSEALYNGVLKIASGSYVQNLGQITQNEMHNEGHFRSAVDLLTFKTEIDNAGVLELVGNDGSTAAQANKIVNGTGTLVLEKNINNSANITQQTIEIATGATVVNSGKLTAGDKIVNNGQLTTGAINIAGNVENNNSLIISSGTVSKNISGTGTTKINGIVELAAGNAIHNNIVIDTDRTLVAAADKLTGTISNEAGLLRWLGGTNANDVSGNGNVNIEGSVINEGKVANTVTILSGNALTTALGNLTSGNAIDNDGSLFLAGNDNLLKVDITGNGVTKLVDGGELKLADGVEIEGILALNKGTLNLQESNGVAAEYQQNDIGGLSNEGYLKIDADMANGDSDRLNLTSSVTRGATVDLRSVNVANDAGAAGNADNYLTYMSSDLAQGLDPITFLLKGKNSDNNAKLVTLTNSWIYTFTLGDKGKLNASWIEATQDNTLPLFIQGIIEADSYSLDSALTMKENIGTTFRENGDREIVLNLNQHTLNGAGFEGITVDNGYTLDLAGSTSGSESGNMSGFTTALKINAGGVANIDDVTFGTAGENTAADIDNNGTVNIAGTTKADKITGASGVLNVAGTGDLTSTYITQNAVTVAEGGKLAVDSDKLQANTMVNDGDVTLAGGIIAGAHTPTTTAISGAGTTTITGFANLGAAIEQKVIVAAGADVQSQAKYMNGAIDNNGTLLLAGNGTDNAILGALTGTGDLTLAGAIANNLGITQNTVTVAQNGVLTNNAALVGAIVNNGTINNITGILGAVDNNGSLTAAASALGGAVDNSGNLALADGDLAQAVSGTGTTTVDGAVHVVTGGLIANNMVVNSGKQLMGLADNLQGDIANEGSVVLGAGTYDKHITGSGTTTVETGSMQLGTNGVAAQNMVVANAGILTANANGLQGNIANAGSVVLTGGSYGKALSGTGTTTVDGNVVLADSGSIAQNIAINSGKQLTANANGLQGDIANTGSVVLTGGSYGKALSGTGTTMVAGNVVLADSGSIAQNIAINSGKQLTADAGKLGGTINNAGTLELTKGANANAINGAGTTLISGSVTNTGAIANNVAVAGTGSLATDAGKLGGTIANAGNLALTGSLDKNVSGNGTTVANGELKFGANAGIEGVLNMNGNTVDMQEASGAAADYAVRNVGSLKGDGALKIDADIAGRQADGLNIASGTKNGGTVNLSSINVRTDGAGGNDLLTYLAGNLNGLNLTVGASGQISTVTNRYQYVFTKGADGKLNVEQTMIESASALKDFIEGNLPVNTDTFSATGNLVVTDTEITLGTTSNSQYKDLNLNLNGWQLAGYDGDSSKHNGIAIDDGYTLNLDGKGAGATAGSNSVMTNFDTALVNNAGGTLNISNMTMAGNAQDVLNNGALNLSGDNAFNSGISGNGQMTVASGTTTVGAKVEQSAINVNDGAVLAGNADNLVAAINNNGTLQLNGGTVQKDISGTGTTAVAGTVYNDQTITQGIITVASDADLVNNGTANARLQNSGAITGNGVLNIAGSSANAGTIAQDTINVAQGAGLSNTTAGTIDGALGNAGTITNDGTITGSVNNTGKMTNNGSLTGSLDNTGTFALGDTGRVEAVLNNSGSISGNSGGGVLTALGNSTNSGFISAELVVGNGTDAADFANTGSLKGAATVMANGVLTSAAANISNVDNNGTLNLSGGNLASVISGSGVTNINGDVVMGSGSMLSSAGSIMVADNGSLDIGSKTVSVHEAMINGALKMNIDEITAGSSSYIGGQLLAANGTTLGSDATLSLTVAAGMLSGKQSSGDLQLIAGGLAGDFAEMLSNNRYTVSKGTAEGTFVISNTASASDVIDGIGNQNNKNTGEAWDVINVADGTLAKEIKNALNELSQHDAQEYVEALTNLAPTDSQLALMTAREVNNLIGREVTHRFDKDGCFDCEPFRKGELWMQALGAYNKQSGRFPSAGFNSRTAGYVLGYDGAYDEDTTLGFGYAFNHTVADSHGRKTDIDGHTLFVYGRWQPSLWYVRGMASYGFADYAEHANVAGYTVKGDYNVHAAGAEAAAGFELPGGLTPELGLRYVYLMQDNYTDSAGQQVKTDDTDVLTVAATLKYSKEFELEETTLKPEVYAGVTYDAVNGNTKSGVRVGDVAYDITGKKLPRLGMEAGVKLTATSGHWDVSAGYDLGLRDDYRSHTGTLELRYNF